MKPERFETTMGERPALMGNLLRQEGNLGLRVLVRISRIRNEAFHGHEFVKSTVDRRRLSWMSRKPTVPCRDLNQCRDDYTDDQRASIAVFGCTSISLFNACARRTGDGSRHKVNGLPPTAPGLASAGDESSMRDDHLRRWMEEWQAEREAKTKERLSRHALAGVAKIAGVYPVRAEKPWQARRVSSGDRPGRLPHLQKIIGIALVPRTLKLNL
jgi:hypothetical protein